MVAAMADVTIYGMKCEFCNYEYETLDNLVRHLCNEHDELWDYEKTYKEALKRIKVDLSILREISESQTIHFVEEGGEIECRFCGKHFSDLDGLLEHAMYVHDATFWNGIKRSHGLFLNPEFLFKNGFVEDEDTDGEDNQTDIKEDVEVDATASEVKEYRNDYYDDIDSDEEWCYSDELSENISESNERPIDVLESDSEEFVSSPDSCSEKSEKDLEESNDKDLEEPLDLVNEEDRWLRPRRKINYGDDSSDSSDDIMDDVTDEEELEVFRNDFEDNNEVNVSELRDARVSDGDDADKVETDFEKDEELLYCEQCDECLDQWASLEAHMLGHHTRTEKCRYCSFQGRRTELFQHVSCFCEGLGFKYCEESENVKNNMKCLDLHNKSDHKDVKSLNDNGLKLTDFSDVVQFGFDDVSQVVEEHEVEIITDVMERDKFLDDVVVYGTKQEVMNQVVNLS